MPTPPAEKIVITLDLKMDEEIGTPAEMAAGPPRRPAPKH
jgi:hypothetical protein